MSAPRIKVIVNSYDVGELSFLWWCSESRDEPPWWCALDTAATIAAAANAGLEHLREVHAPIAVWKGNVIPEMPWCITCWISDGLTACTAATGTHAGADVATHQNRLKVAQILFQQFLEGHLPSTPHTT